MNLYEDKNAYYYDSDYAKRPRPGQRDYLGNINYSVGDDNRLEAVIGSKSRSGRQYDIWEATRFVSGISLPVKLITRWLNTGGKIMTFATSWSGTGKHLAPNWKAK